MESQFVRQIFDENTCIENLKKKRREETTHSISLTLTHNQTIYLYIIVIIIEFMEWKKIPYSRRIGRMGLRVLNIFFVFSRCCL